jgi:GDSL-like Lipase/Acylhydrolase family
VVRATGGCVALLALFAGLATSADARMSDVTAQRSALTARALVRLDRRADAAKRAWDVRSHRFRDDYVRPKRWQVTLSGCRSRGPIARYRWGLRSLDGQGQDSVRLARSRCGTKVKLPRLGRWRVHLTVRSSTGAVDGTVRTVALRDLLVVSVGDSLSSGEGNPDVNRQTVIESRRECRHFHFRPPRDCFRVVPAEWMDQQCHRSARSWSARVARRLQNARTTVTFLNYACSGAEIAQIGSSTYRGIESGDALPPQLEAVRNQLGPPGDFRTPQVDVLLMTAGVNDLGFGDLLLGCAKSVGTDCVSSGEADDVRAALPSLPQGYRRLDVAFSTYVKAAQVYVAEYPARIFTDENDRYPSRTALRFCGAFSGGIGNSEARWITDRAEDLNAALRTAARSHGWVYVRDVRDKFRKHGYCADPGSWFRSYTGSNKLQGNEKGTAHPSGDGPAAIADLALPHINTRAVAPPLQRVTVELLSVRVDNNGLQMPCLSCQVSVAMLGLPPQKFTAVPIGSTTPLSGRSMFVDTTGNTLELSAGALVGGLGLPRPLRATKYLARDQGWGPGVDAIGAEDQGRSFVVEYRVTAGPPPPVACFICP